MSVPETAYGYIASSEREAIVREVAPAKSTEDIVRAYFKDIPVLAEIARCESSFQHELADGSILSGKTDPADTGVMQINKRYHQAAANAMQLDLDDLQENMEYARHLFETQGTRPWSASMPCWGNSLAMN